MCFASMTQSRSNAFQMRQKSNPLKLFFHFLRNRLEFQCEILSIYVTFLSTLNCQEAFKIIFKHDKLLA